MNNLQALNLIIGLITGTNGAYTTEAAAGKAILDLLATNGLTITDYTGDLESGTFSQSYALTFAGAAASLTVSKSATGGKIGFTTPLTGTITITDTFLTSYSLTALSATLGTSHLKAGATISMPQDTADHLAIDVEVTIRNKSGGYGTAKPNEAQGGASTLYTSFYIPQGGSISYRQKRNAPTGISEQDLIDYVGAIPLNWNFISPNTATRYPKLRLYDGGTLLATRKVTGSSHTAGVAKVADFSSVSFVYESTKTIASVITALRNGNLFVEVELSNVI